MSSQVRKNYFDYAYSVNAAKAVNRKWWFNRLTLSGKLLFVLSLLISISPYESLRIPIGGVLIHPYLFVVGPLFFLIALPQINRFPQRTLFILAFFVFLYSLSTALGSEKAPDEILKIVASGVTIVTVALMVRTKEDFKTAVIALSIAAVILCLQNLLGAGTFRAQARVEGAIANKNGFSVYVLPPLLLAGFLTFDTTVSKRLRLVLIGCMLIIIVALFTSGNRSGWLGAIFIGIMFYGRGRRIRSTVLLCILAFGAYYTIVNYLSPKIFEQRVQKTIDSSQSDAARPLLLTTSLEIAFENPLRGVSPQGLQLELARRLPTHAVWAGKRLVVDSHNVVMDILGGCGIFTFAVFLYLGWLLWRRPHPVPVLPNTKKAAMSSHAALRVMMLLWFLRGMFTREVLYSPAFCIGFGLLIGMCILEGVWSSRAVYRARFLQSWLQEQYRSARQPAKLKRASRRIIT